MKNSKILDSKTNKVIFDYNMYIEACQIIADDIKNKHDLENENIGILGLARGGLPMLVTLSHLLNIRDIASMQIKTSNTNDSHDFGESTLVSLNINKNIKKYILFDDIVYKGRTIKEALKHLKENNIEIIDIYTLIKHSEEEDIIIKENINYVYKMNNNKNWVYFFWEENINELK